MAIAFDAASSLAGTAVSSLTFSHTCAGANRYMHVGAGNYQPATQTVSTVTFNGVSLSEINESAGADMNASIWELIAPAAVTANVVVTYTAAADEVAAGAVSFTGVDQSTPRRGTYALATGTSTTASVNIASAVNDWVIDFVACSNPNGITGGAGQTERWSREDVDGFSSYGSSTEAGAATTTMSWTLVASTEWRIYAISLIPASSGTTHEVAITESATASEVVNSSGNIFTASRTEAGTASESPDASRIMPVSITEAGTATEASDRLLAMAASIIEAGEATEASDRLFIALALITEAATAIETNSGLTTAIAAITEAVTALDESNFLGSIYEVEITEAGAATDSQSALITLVASILEAITAEDTHNALRTTIAAIIEANTADDLSSVANVMVADITETATAEDILSSALIIAAGIIESGVPLDTLDSVKIAVASIIEAGLSTDSMDATLISIEVGGFGNIEYERRKREKERLKAILTEDEELIAMVASFMEVITKRWVH